MTSDILISLLKANLAAAGAILIVLVLRKSVRRLFGPRVAYALWLTAPLAALASLLPARTIVLRAVVASPVAEMGAQTPAGALIDLSTAVLGLWIAGLVASLMLLIWRQRRFVASLGGLARDGRYLRAAASGVGPAVVGAIFPRIVLPADFESRFDAHERRIVLAHEAAHLAAGDTAVNAFAALAQCLAWFNPLVHLGVGFLRIDQELACDAMVLASHPGDRRTYAQALLKTQLTTTQLPLGCYWPALGGNPLKERIAMLKAPSPSTGRLLMGAASVAALCLSAGVAAWAAQPTQVRRAEPDALMTATAEVGMKGSQARTGSSGAMVTSRQHSYLTKVAATQSAQRSLSAKVVSRTLTGQNRGVDIEAKGDIYPHATSAQGPLDARSLTYAARSNSGVAPTVMKNGNLTYRGKPAGTAVAVPQDGRRAGAISYVTASGEHRSLEVNGQSQSIYGDAVRNQMAVRQHAEDTVKDAVNTMRVATDRLSVAIASRNDAERIAKERSAALRDTPADSRDEASNAPSVTEREARANRGAVERARLKADYNRVTVTKNEGRGSFSTWTPKNFTSEAKAHALARLDQEIDRTRPASREGFLKARDVIARMPTTD